MNEWLLLYDDGTTPAIHTKMVTAATMYSAIEEACFDLVIKSEQIWCCVLRSQIGVGANALYAAGKVWCINEIR